MLAFRMQRQRQITLMLPSHPSVPFPPLDVTEAENVQIKENMLSCKISHKILH